jgi:saccharopine dehydrogenase (NAD+, L-lysine forming)
MYKIGIIREGKVPSDARVALTPSQCVEAMARFPVQVVVQPSPVRCFPDAAYTAAGIALQEDLRDCDVLLGIKEVPVPQLIADKTYLFFSHTIKKQPYNRNLLQAVLERNIRLIDYEVLTDERGARLIAFGYYAGIVGAHNGIWAYGQRTGACQLPRMYQCLDYAAVSEHYKNLALPPIHVVLTGGGRVASGAVKNLHDMGIRQVSPPEFLKKTYNEPVFVQLFAQDYVQHSDGKRIFDKQHFYAHGDAYVSAFAPYYRRADVFINGIFYDKKAPAFFTVAEMQAPDFRISVVADISCDIAPAASVPCTVRAGTIAEPLYGFYPATGETGPPHLPGSVDVMAIDNLPSELPRDASAFFGQQMMDNILPRLLQFDHNPVIVRGTIAENGRLTNAFEYLSDYVGIPA